jgi:hypothetical protein
MVLITFNDGFISFIWWFHLFPFSFKGGFNSIKGWYYCNFKNCNEKDVMNMRNVQYHVIYKV